MFTKVCVCVCVCVCVGEFNLFLPDPPLLNFLFYYCFPSPTHICCAIKRLVLWPLNICLSCCIHNYFGLITVETQVDVHAAVFTLPSQP